MREVLKDTLAGVDIQYVECPECEAVPMMATFECAVTDADTQREFRKYAKQGYSIKVVRSGEKFQSLTWPHAPECMHLNKKKQSDLFSQPTPIDL